MFMHTEVLLEQAREDSYMDACERVSPNAPEFNELHERLCDAASEPAHRYEALRQEGYPHHEALLKAGLTNPKE